MKVSMLRSTDFDAFIAFNRKAFPHRENVKAYFESTVLQNPHLEERDRTHCLIALDDGDRIIGQLPLNPMVCWLHGKSTLCHVGFDYYVEDGSRNTGAGALLAYRGIQGFKPYFGIGPSETARRISESLKAESIGAMYKWIWLRNAAFPFTLLTGAISRNSDSPANVSRSIDGLPRRLDDDGKVFCQASTSEGIVDSPWNDHVISFSRSPEVLKWRFLDRPGYALYRSDAHPSTYFTVRTGRWKGLRWLILVDYRVRSGHREDFCSILKAVKRLSRALSSHGILTMSSHCFFDTRLRENKFLRVGKPILIMSNVEHRCSVEEIEKHRCIITTMADSDIEFNAGVY